MTRKSIVEDALDSVGSTFDREEYAKLFAQVIRLQRGGAPLVGPAPKAGPSVSGKPWRSSSKKL